MPGSIVRLAMFTQLKWKIKRWKKEGVAQKTCMGVDRNSGNAQKCKFFLWRPPLSFWQSDCPWYTHPSHATILLIRFLHEIYFFLWSSVVLWAEVGLLSVQLHWAARPECRLPSFCNKVFQTGYIWCSWCKYRLYRKSIDIKCGYASTFLIKKNKHCQRHNRPEGWVHLTY